MKTLQAIYITVIYIKFLLNIAILVYTDSWMDIDLRYKICKNY